MNILCGTDFSEPSETAARAAARLCAAFRSRLHLVHVAQLPGIRAESAGAVQASSQEEFERRRKLLADLAGRLRALGAQVQEHLAEGVPDEQLLALARELSVECIVIAPIGDRVPTLWSLGGVAMRVVKGAHVPTLVVREESSLEAWLRGTRELRVMLGVDARTPIESPAAALERFARAGKLEVIAGLVYARGERRDAPRERYEAELLHGLGQRVGSIAGKPPQLRVLAGWGRVAEHVLELAALEAADLVVVGTHRRTGMDRLVHGSVSLDLIGASARNVLTCPLEYAHARANAARREYRRVLVPVDLSEFSARAVEHAASLLPKGGVLQLVHVVAPYMPPPLDYGALVSVPPPSPEETARVDAEVRRKLLALAPPDAAARHIETHVEVIRAFNPVEQICAASQRLDSDVICLSTHGRSGLSKLVLGSVAEGVIRHAHTPVLVLPPRVH